MTASNRHPSTLYSHNITQSFSRGTRPYTFPRSTKHVCTSLAGSQDFLKICWSLEISSVVLRPRKKTTLGIIEKKHKKRNTGLWLKKKKTRKKTHWALVQLFSRHLSIHSSWEAKQRDAAVVGSFITVSLFVCGDGQFTNFSAPFQNDMPLDTHELVKSSSVPSSPNSLSNF